MKNIRELWRRPIIRQIRVAFGPIVLTAVLGQTIGYSAIILPQLQQVNSTIKIDTRLSSLIASTYALPMAAGCLLGGYLMEKIGRRGIHIMSCLPFTVGWFIIAAANTSAYILIGRFIVGLGNGFLGPSHGVYIAETSHPKVRGVLIITTWIAITFGIFSVHLLGTFLSWRTTALICGIIPIPVTIFICFVPESPTYLAKMNKIEAATEAFYWCRGKSKESERELQELISRQVDLNNTPKVSLIQRLKSLSQPEFWKPAIITSVFFFTAQITGTTAISSYSIQIARLLGITGEILNEYSATIIADLTRMVAAMISCILIMTMKRRTLAMISGYGICVIILLLCSYLYLASRKIIISTFFPLVILMSYVYTTAVGVLPLAWTIMGELFPLAHRGLGSAIASLVCYGSLFLVTHTFPYLLELFGNILWVFVLYGVCTLSGTIFLTLFLPETKDKALYVIEDNFKQANCRSAVIHPE